MVAFACGRGACWACWGTVSLRSWANFWRSWKVWRVWGLANGSLERVEKKPLLRPWGALEPLLWPCGGFCLQRWAWQGFKKDRIHTSGGPRRRPGLGKGRGRRIYIYIYIIWEWVKLPMKWPYDWGNLTINQPSLRIWETKGGVFSRRDDGTLPLISSSRCRCREGTIGSSIYGKPPCGEIGLGKKSLKFWINYSMYMLYDVICMYYYILLLYITIKLLSYYCYYYYLRSAAAAAADDDDYDYFCSSLIATWSYITLCRIMTVLCIFWYSDPKGPWDQAVKTPFSHRAGTRHVARNPAPVGGQNPSIIPWQKTVFHRNPMEF